MGDGGSLQLPLGDMIALYIISGTPTITGSLNIESSGVPLRGHYMRILVRTGATLGESGVLAIEGNSIGVAAYNRLFEVIYDGVAWNVFEVPQYTDLG